MRLTESQIAARGGWEECPFRTGLQRWDLDSSGAPSSRPVTVSCGKLRCPFCLQTRIWKTSLAIAHSAPSRYAVLTGIPTDDWSVNRKTLERVWQALQRDEVRAGRRELALRAWYCYEVNPAGTGFHLNIWWWGPDVPQKRLSEVSESVGWGSVVDVRRWSSSTVAYGMKEATNYGLKELDSSHETGKRLFLTEHQEAYLARNGGRLMGSRRGRFRPWRDGVKGPQLSGERETLRAYWERKGAVRNGSVITDRNGVAFSRDIGPEVQGVPDLRSSGRWRRAAPGRSDWAWGSWDSEGSADLFSDSVVS